MGVRLVGDDAMASTETQHSATCVDECWEVSWLPDRALSRDDAVTALMLVELYHTLAELPATHRRWRLARQWESEIGIDERHRPLG